MTRPTKYTLDFCAGAVTWVTVVSCWFLAGMGMKSSHNTAKLGSSASNDASISREEPQQLGECKSPASCYRGVVDLLKHGRHSNTRYNTEFGCSTYDTVAHPSSSDGLALTTKGSW